MTSTAPLIWRPHWFVHDLLMLDFDIHRQGSKIASTAVQAAVADAYPSTCDSNIPVYLSWEA